MGVYISLHFEIQSKSNIPKILLSHFVTLLPSPASIYRQILHARLTADSEIERSFTIIYKSRMRDGHFLLTADTVHEAN